MQFSRGIPNRKLIRDKEYIADIKYNNKRQLYADYVAKNLY